MGVSANKASTVLAGNLAKASSVGANTVNGPGPFNVSTKPAAVIAAAKVLKITWSYSCINNIVHVIPIENLN